MCRWAELSFVSTLVRQNEAAAESVSVGHNPKRHQADAPINTLL